MRSELAIFDVRSGDVKSVIKTRHLIEAPNWTPDGKALVVNGNGKLFRVPLDSPKMIEIGSGFANRINNDHGISPDGTKIIFSDSTEFGESAIYVMPFCGGTPECIVSKTPSYWHGCSPDGRSIAYVARRKTVFDVYTCPIEGRAETQITREFDHCDGPDYTPDGQWIWFNGERNGSVQLWRMRPDGSELTQMTNDERVNWFPHPSPDGRHIVYLAYLPGVRGHPRGLDVELRLMPAEGGKPEILLKLRGGQGSINVPCWAPDGNQFAFMRYQAVGPG